MIEDEAEADTNETSADGETIECRYIRSGMCRSIHVDGGIVEFGPRNQITVALYAEHFPPPIRERFIVKGRTANALDTEDASGFVREIEAVCYLDIETARLLSTQLSEVLRGLEEED